MSNIIKDHLGNIYKSVNEMCCAYNISRTAYENRLIRGWTIEETLTKDNQKFKTVKDHLGNEYRSEREMCRAYNIEPNTYRYRIKSGWTQEEALLGRNITDHLGNKYKSIKEMCQAYNINQVTYLNRLKYGWTQEEALTALKKNIDYKGFYIIDMYRNDEVILYKVKNLETNEEMILTKEMLNNYRD